MVREFLAHLDTKERTNQVKIRGKIVNFTPAALNRLLGTPSIDPQGIKDLIFRPPYREIRHTLSGPNSVVTWAYNQQYRDQQIEEEVVDYSPRYEPKGLEVTKTKETKGIHDLMLSISKHNMRIDNVHSHLSSMKMLHLSFEEPIDDDDATNKEQARVDYNLECDSDDEDHSEMGEAAYAPTDDKD
ncbi:hypothetical protein HAX54_023544 [Datura stramonium]|uniref:Uncharacterized protein n=1 Tax=Datura stramonium TaxID=4076 RepID=A0ABS8S4S5_DATST|nr:hypothetical protein [Datura stramonium]